MWLLLVKITLFWLSVKTNSLQIINQTLNNFENYNSILNKTFNQGKTMQGAEPKVRNQIGYLVGLVDQYFSHQIPNSTFYDLRDGFTNNLKLELLTEDGLNLFSHSWIALNKSTLQIYGFPLSGNMGRFSFHLKATNSLGLSAVDEFQVFIWNRANHYTHVVKLHTTMTLAKYSIDLNTRIKFSTILANFVFGIQPKYIWVKNFTGGIFQGVFQNLQSSKQCNREMITEIKNKLFEKNNRISNDLIQVYKGFTDIINVELILYNECLDRPLSESNHDLSWLKAIAPLALLGGVVGIPTFIALIVCHETRKRLAKIERKRDKQNREDREIMLKEFKKYEQECGLLDKNNDEEIRNQPTNNKGEECRVTVQQKNEVIKSNDMTQLKIVNNDIPESYVLSIQNFVQQMQTMIWNYIEGLFELKIQLPELQNNDTEIPVRDLDLGEKEQSMRQKQVFDRERKIGLSYDSSLNQLTNFHNHAGSLESRILLLNPRSSNDELQQLCLQGQKSEMTGVNSNPFENPYTIETTALPCKYVRFDKQSIKRHSESLSSLYPSKSVIAKSTEKRNPFPDSHSLDSKTRLQSESADATHFESENKSWLFPIRYHGSSSRIHTLSTYKMIDSCASDLPMNIDNPDHTSSFSLCAFGKSVNDLYGATEEKYGLEQNGRLSLDKDCRLEQLRRVFQRQGSRGCPEGQSFDTSDNLCIALDDITTGR